MSFLDGITKSLNNTKQETEIGIGGFRMFARVAESVGYSNTVPVVVLEDGSNAADDILNNPISVSIDGVVGDNFVEGRQYPSIINRDFSSVGEVTEFIPARSAQQLQRIAQIDAQFRDVALKAERLERVKNNTYEFFNNSASTVKTEQEKFIEYMEAIYFGRQLTRLSTSLRDYDNMALQDLTINRDNQSGEVKFSAKFLQVNYAELIFVPISRKYASPSKAIKKKVADKADKGSQTPETNTESVLHFGVRKISG